MMKKLLPGALLAGILLAGRGGVQVNGQAAAPGVAEKGLAKSLTVDWKTVSLNFSHANPLIATGQSEVTDASSLTISGMITVTEPGTILGFDRFGSFEVTRILDEAGHDLTAMSSNSQHDRWFGPLSYSQQFDPDTHQLVDHLQPEQFNIGLKVGEHLPSCFSVIDGEVHLLTCDHIDHVDVPYVEGDAVTEVLPTARLHFKKASQDASGYSYQLLNDAEDRMHGNENFDGQVNERRSLPDRAVINKYLIGEDGKPLIDNHHSFGSFNSAGAENGSGSMQGARKIASMRFEIASGLHEQKVPVTLKNIDLPQMGAVRAILPLPEVELAPIDRAEQDLIQRLESERAHASTNGWTDAKDQHVREMWKMLKADYNQGVKTKVAPAKIMDTMPDVKSYDEYLGTYKLTPPNVEGVRHQTTQPAGRTSAAKPQAVEVVIKIDEQGHLLLDIGKKGLIPLAARDGGLFGTFDPMFQPTDRLDPKSEPKLAGLWIVRSGGKTTMYFDAGRSMPPMPLEPVKQP